MDPTFRLRTATRLHFLLLRRYGQDIDVNLLLKSQATKHDGLWLCRATGDKELILLARRLAHANHAHALDEARLREAAASMARSAAGATARELPWGRDTSGFGLTNPQELNALPSGVARRAGHWLNPRHWLNPGPKVSGH